jgi:hypothetical protein
MNLKQAGFLLSLLWLTGCAATGPISTIDSDDSNRERQKDTSNSPDAAVTVRTTRPSYTPTPYVANDTTVADEIEALTLPQLLYRLDHATTLDSSAKKERIQQMNARFAQLKPADRFEFVLLLSHKDMNNKSLNRAISILNGLEEYIKDPIVRELIRLYRSYFVIKKEYRSERNKTVELNKKIEHLKGLEQDLDKSNSRIQESLNPMPGDAQQP